MMYFKLRAMLSNLASIMSIFHNSHFYLLNLTTRPYKPINWPFTKDWLADISNQLISSNTSFLFPSFSFTFLFTFIKLPLITTDHCIRACHLKWIFPILFSHNLPTLSKFTTGIIPLKGSNFQRRIQQKKIKKTIFSQFSLSFFEEIILVLKSLKMLSGIA